MGDHDHPADPRSRPLALAGIAISGVLASGFLGATTNAVNGYVSPRYFVTILGWDDVADVCARALRRGRSRDCSTACSSRCCSPRPSGSSRGRVSLRLHSSISWGYGPGPTPAGLWAVWRASGWRSWPEFYSRTFIGVPAQTGRCFGMPGSVGRSWGAGAGWSRVGDPGVGCPAGGLAARGRAGKESTDSPAVAVHDRSGTWTRQAMSRRACPLSRLWVAEELDDGTDVRGTDRI